MNFSNPLHSAFAYPVGPPGSVVFQGIPGQPLQDQQYDDGSFMAPFSSLPSPTSPPPLPKATRPRPKRPNHNEMERKDCIGELKDVIPTLQIDKPSTALILQTAKLYIDSLKARVAEMEDEIFATREAFVELAEGAPEQRVALLYRQAESNERLRQENADLRRLLEEQEQRLYSKTAKADPQDINQLPPQQEKEAEWGANVPLPGMEPRVDLVDAGGDAAPFGNAMWTMPPPISDLRLQQPPLAPSAPENGQSFVRFQQNSVFNGPLLVTAPMGLPSSTALVLPQNTMYDEQIKSENASGDGLGGTENNQLVMPGQRRNTTQIDGAHFVQHQHSGFFPLGDAQGPIEPDLRASRHSVPTLLASAAGAGSFGVSAAPKQPSLPALDALPSFSLSSGQPLDSISDVSYGWEDDEVRCRICHTANNGTSMLQCDKCRNWHHSQCIGLDVGKPPDSWVCSSCAGG